MKVGILTSGGNAPCLSASIGFLVNNYYLHDPNIKIFGYLYGYKGLLTDKKIRLDGKVSKFFLNHGGTPLGNSRVKLSNVDDCINNKYINEGENPIAIAAEKLKADNIKVLHVIGGDDTNTTAAELVAFLKKNNYDLTVVGMPKTIDNDIYPIVQTLGAVTAAETGAKFFNNIVNESTTSSRQLIIHEVMGRNCGWLAAATANYYRNNLLNKKKFIDNTLINIKSFDIHALYIPEIDVDFNQEIIRLNKIMDHYDSVNIFLSEGACLSSIIKQKEKNGEKLKYDAFGHVRLDEINPGQWFSDYFSKKINAHKVLVQKSGYFSRSAAPNSEDLDLINKSALEAFSNAIKGQSGVVGKVNLDSKPKLISFDQIKGGKVFDVNQDWFVKLYKQISSTI